MFERVLNRGGDEGLSSLEREDMIRIQETLNALRDVSDIVLKVQRRMIRARARERLPRPIAGLL